VDGIVRCFSVASWIAPQGDSSPVREEWIEAISFQNPFRGFISETRSALHDALRTSQYRRVIAEFITRRLAFLRDESLRDYHSLGVALPTCPSHLNLSQLFGKHFLNNCSDHRHAPNSLPPFRTCPHSCRNVTTDSRPVMTITFSLVEKYEPSLSPVPSPSKMRVGLTL